MDSAAEKYFHQLPPEKVVSILGSDFDVGLTPAEVQQRQAKFGPNAISTRAGHGPLVRFLLHFHQPLVYILLAASIITAALHEWVDSAVIFGVVIVNVIIGFLQESKAAKALEALAKMTITESRVLRGATVQTVPSTQLVPGDVVLLQSGDKTPADLRLFRSRDLQIDESALTGESVPVQKSTEPVAAETSLAERSSIAYASTLVTYGQGRGVVFAIGNNTEVGRISGLVSSADALETPLTRKIASFSRILLVVILVLAALTFAVGIYRGQEPLEMFMAAVALSVGAIPEGLPAAITITLAIGVARMARRRAIIRKLPAVETLGSTTTICSDKTGTLTVNQMTVCHLWAASAHYTFTGSGYDPEGDVAPEGTTTPIADHVAARECLQAGLLCNDSSLTLKEERWDVTGDPTEGALIASYRKSGLDEHALRQHLPRLDSVPFESQHQYMATLHARDDAATPICYMKGAVEAILSKCKDALDANGQRVELYRTVILEQLESMAAQGLRVLAFAMGELPTDKRDLTHADIAGLTFLGLQGMIDPPRPEAIHAVRAFQTAGVRVKMITGDHALTARAIAHQLGLQNSHGAPNDMPLAMTSHELADKTDEELIEIAQRVDVFARATPEQKLRLVRALQAKGHVVAMTGDGVNDAPALKQANIGVAMGVGGTEVAKEASDMILTDDNFATIEAAVEEGRGVFDNLTKFIVWTLPTNLGEGLVILAAVFAGTHLPITPVQILWINMTTAVLLGLMLAFEPKERDIMLRKPRDPDTPILTGTLITRICLVGLILLVGAFGSFKWAIDQGKSYEYATTVAVNVFVIVELFYLFNCRSLTKSMFAIGLFSNHWISIGVATMIALQLAFTYVPFMNRIFHSAPIDWDAWWRILLTGFAAYVIVGIEKWLRRKWSERQSRLSAAAA
jgi:Ca2+-transporting ATPase